MKKLVGNTVQLVKELAPIVRDIVLAPIAIVLVALIKMNFRIRKQKRQRELQLNK